MAIESDDPATGELPRVSADDTGGPPRPHRFRPFRFTLKLLAFFAIVYFAMVTIVPGVREATGAFCNEAKLRCVSLHRVLQEAASKVRSTRLFYPAELAMTSDGAAVVGRWFADEIYRWLGELGFRS